MAKPKRTFEMLKSKSSKLALLGTTLAAVGSQAYAAVPTGVKEGIEGAGTDAMTVGGYVIIAAVALFAVGLILKIMR
jgi:hypothetical protein